MAKFYTTGYGDFFQVVHETKTTVTVRPIKSESLGVTTVYTAFDYDVKCRAIENDFTTCWWFDDKQNANGKRCKKDANGHIIINPYHRIYAYPSDGTEEYNRDLG
jgi:hypothetical protein